MESGGGVEDWEGKGERGGERGREGEGGGDIMKRARPRSGLWDAAGRGDFERGS